MICVGCGLFDPDDGINPVRVAVSGAWDGPGLAFVGGDLVGAPVYCDGDGELRTVPEHDAVPFTDGAYSAVGGGYSNSIVEGNTVQIVLTNPSAARGASYLLVYFAKMGVTINTTGCAFRINVAQDGGAEVTRVAKQWSPPFSEPYIIDDILTDQIAGTLVAGGSVTFDITPGIDGTYGGGAGTLGAQTVRSDAIIATRSV